MRDVVATFDTAVLGRVYGYLVDVDELPRGALLVIEGGATYIVVTPTYEDSRCGFLRVVCLDRCPLDQLLHLDPGWYLSEGSPGGFFSYTWPVKMYRIVAIDDPVLEALLEDDEAMAALVEHLAVADQAEIAAA